MIPLNLFLTIWGATIVCTLFAFIYSLVLGSKFRKLTRLVRAFNENVALMSRQRGVKPPDAVLVRKWRKEYKAAKRGSERKQLYKDKLMEYHLLNGD